MGSVASAFPSPSPEISVDGTRHLLTHFLSCPHTA